MIRELLRPLHVIAIPMSGFFLMAVPFFCAPSSQPPGIWIMISSAIGSAISTVLIGMIPLPTWYRSLIRKWLPYNIGLAIIVVTLGSILGWCYFHSFKNVLYMGIYSMVIFFTGLSTSYLLFGLHRYHQYRKAHTLSHP